MNGFLKKMMVGGVAALALFQVETAGATDLVLVVHPSLGDLGSVSSQELKNLYLGKTTSLGGKDVKLVGLDDGTADQGKFLKDVLGMSSEELKNYWIQESLKGGGTPPRTMANASSLSTYISRKDGSAGYLTAGEAQKSGLKTIEIK